MSTKNHGGKRAGSGRRKVSADLIKIPVCYKLPAWLVEWIREQDTSAAVLIEQALTQSHRLKKPNL